mmetsp:Transcript_21556/g.57322  ORF Transcript_21556/g.57322 Transcript_21556/m.57322 type:complete len:160 (-) Transcript_21556:197-676(-)
MTAILRSVSRYRAWYSDLSAGEKGLLAMAYGNVIGTLYGTYVRRGHISAADSECLVVTTYTVEDEKKKEFEGHWNDTARLAQRQPGYEWTRTLKALNWENSPFHYLTFRMWGEVACFQRYVKYDDTLKELMRRVGLSCVAETSSVYKVVVDDSVRRIIY